MTDEKKHMTEHEARDAYFLTPSGWIFPVKFPRVECVCGHWMHPDHADYHTCEVVPTKHRVSWSEHWGDPRGAIKLVWMLPMVCEAPGYIGHTTF